MRKGEIYKLLSLGSWTRTKVLWDLGAPASWALATYDSVDPRNLNLKCWMTGFYTLWGPCTFLVQLCAHVSDLPQSYISLPTPKWYVELQADWAFCCRMDIFRVGEAAQGKEHSWLYWDLMSLTKMCCLICTHLLPCILYISLVNVSFHFPRQCFSRHTLPTYLKWLLPTPQSQPKALLLFF